MPPRIRFALEVTTFAMSVLAFLFMFIAPQASLFLNLCAMCCLIAIVFSFPNHRF